MGITGQNKHKNDQIQKIFKKQKIYWPKLQNTKLMPTANDYSRWASGLVSQEPL